jgi:hypothetical protein
MRGLISVNEFTKSIVHKTVFFFFFKVQMQIGGMPNYFGMDIQCCLTSFLF